jgi:hypothetical protein
LETLRKHGIGYDAHSGPTLGPRVEEEEEAKEEEEEGEGEL